MIAQGGDAIKRQISGTPSPVVEAAEQREELSGRGFREAGWWWWPAQRLRFSYLLRSPQTNDGRSSAINRS